MGLKRSHKLGSKTNGRVRIIGGTWRGRYLNVGEHPELRPSTDRNRETLFNWLMHEVEGAACLDLFAGTGVLGFEALSRGAASLVMIEQDLKLSKTLTDNQHTLTADNSIIHTDALHYLAGCTETFDLIFIDPPFHKGLVADVCEIIHTKCLLKQHGYLYIESESAIVLPDYLIMHKQKIAGQVQYGLYKIKV